MPQSTHSGARGPQLPKPIRQRETTAKVSPHPAAMRSARASQLEKVTTQHRGPSTVQKKKPRWSCLCPINCGGTRFFKSGLTGLGSWVFLVSCGSSQLRIKPISWSVLIPQGRDET